jgi:hypothetical protein
MAAILHDVIGVIFIIAVLVFGRPKEIVFHF